MYDTTIQHYNLMCDPAFARQCVYDNHSCRAVYAQRKTSYYLWVLAAMACEVNTKHQQLCAFWIFKACSLVGTSTQCPRACGEAINSWVFTWQAH